MRKKGLNEEEREEREEANRRMKYVVPCIKTLKMQPN